MDPTAFDTLTDGNALLLAAVADGPVGPMDALLAVGPDGSIVELAQLAQRGGRSITALPDGGALLYGRTLSMGEVDDDTDLLVSIPAP